MGETVKLFDFNLSSIDDRDSADIIESPFSRLNGVYQPIILFF